MSTSTDTLNIVLSICAPTLAAVLASLLLRLRAKMGKQDTAIDKANLEAEVQASIGVGLSVVAQSVPQILKDGITTPAGLQDVASAAASYFRQRFPDRTAQISAAADNGTRTEDIHAAVQQTIVARLTNGNSTPALAAGLLGGLGAVTTSAAPTLPAPSP